MNDLLSDIQILKELEAKKDEATKQYSDFLRDMNRHSPVKIGDKIECNGYAHEGKLIEVDSIAYKKGYRGEYSFVAKGNVIKKDGKPGQHRGEWFENR